MSSTHRFVVLHHTGIAKPHFDIMVEDLPGGNLVTWRSRRWPLPAKTDLTRLPDHRAAYLTFEGPVPGNRGMVSRMLEADARVTRKTEIAGAVVWSIEWTADGTSRALDVRENSDKSVRGITRSATYRPREPSRSGSRKMDDLDFHPLTRALRSRLNQDRKLR